MEQVDIVILGAGISGIGAAWHISTQCPGKTFAVLERRASFGGTWDFFRYPGIRSDSDMFTFGYHFKPWSSSKPIASGDDILGYMQEVLKDFDLDKHIRYNSDVTAAEWSTPEARWFLQTAEGQKLSCKFLVGCSGLYFYDQPHEPEFPGQATFRGRIVHPQRWNPQVDYEGKRVAVIGSGATAVTLVPNLATKAKHVTMVQRSPTYIVAGPEKDFLAVVLGKLLPASLMHSIVRSKNIVMFMFVFNIMRRFPNFWKKTLVGWVEAELKGHMDPEEVRKHFTPRYNPWDQRLCLAPAGDIFGSMRKGLASVVTGHIERFTETGLRMEDGQEVEADLIVTATGFKLQNKYPMSTMQVSVDGHPYDPTENMIYKGMMISDVPNFIFCVGYTNASWTLKVDLTCAWLVRLLKHMDQNSSAIVCPKKPNDMEEEDYLPLTSSYIQRAKESMPKQGDRPPWKVYQNYFVDAWDFRKDITDPGLVFDGGRPASRL